MKRTMTVLFGVSALMAAAPLAAAPLTVAGQPPHDLCDVAGHQYLIGKAMKDLVGAPAGEVWRMRSDKAGREYGYRPNRLTILWDEGSGRVVGLRCG